MSNLLFKETSPYLQQHKDNPIHWLPYTDDAFEKARKENKPIFLSIGYSSCHWCHVMARESFSDPETANYMNEHFVCIKMDREEYPGIDKAYQEMFQLVNRRGGGWPLSVYALPDGAPFVLATYIPKESKYGMKSFMTVNKEIVHAWKTQHTQIVNQANAIMEGLEQYVDFVKSNPQSLNLSDSLIVQQIQTLQLRFDRKHGGFGPAPKFPRISTLRFLLQEGMSRDQKDLVEFVRFTFHKMARGGIYDQLGGGFARYSVDEKWLVPHFEKMAYDNAGFILLGSEIYAATKDSFVKWIVFDTISWVARDLRSKYGGFYSSLNAESEGREGKYYVWTKDELEEILGDLYPLSEMRYGITKSGNFKDPHHPEINGMNILKINMEVKEIAKQLKIDEDRVLEDLNTIRQMLFEKRSDRIPPSRDTKIITSWNAMLIHALLVCAEKLDLDDASKLALDALDFLLETNYIKDTVIHSFHDSNDGQIHRQIQGNIDDYAILIRALIQAFEYTDRWMYMEKAKELEQLATNYFYSEADNAYFVNKNHAGNLFNRVIQVSDESMVSGFAVMIENLYKLGKYLEDDVLISRGKAAIERYIGGSTNFPGSMNGMMIAAMYYLVYPAEIVMVDTKGSLDKSFHSTLQPMRLVYRWNERNNKDGRPKWKVLEGRDSVNDPTVFICQGMTCSLPLTTTQSVISELS